MSGCCSTAPKASLGLGGRKIALVGNPNAGKSVVFNALTGMYVDVSNYPGTTLDISQGRLGGDTLIDTPGVYGISSLNDEETVARDVILNADIVINVVNATMLERDLFLTQHVIDAGLPLVVALNMMDEAERDGLKIDTESLSRHLGVPVVPMVATEGKGMAEIKAAVDSAVCGNQTPLAVKLVGELQSGTGSYGELLLAVEGDGEVAGRIGLQPGDHQLDLYEARRKRVDGILAEVAPQEGEGKGFGVWLGRVMLGGVSGLAILGVLLYAAYRFLGIFVAGTVVGFTEVTIMEERIQPVIVKAIEGTVGLQGFIGRLLAGEFGVLTMGLTYVVGLLLPLVIGFYLLLSLLEDSGYLPRIAALVDRLMGRIGLNGRAVIPIILGFGCVTMATVTTRLLGSDRERRIAIFLLGLSIPCSAQLGVITGVLTGLGWEYVTVYMASIMAVMVAAGTLMNAVLPGKATDLLIDLPRLRMPRVRNVATKTFTKSLGFLTEAAPIFAIGAVLITVLDATGLLAGVQGAMKPLTVDFLGLPKEASTAFVMGLIRRDFAAAGLADMGLSAPQALISLIVITLFVPCIATVLVLIKERGLKEAMLVWLGTVVIAFAVSGGVARVIPAPNGGLASILPALAAIIGPVVVLGLVRTLRSKGNMGSVQLEGR